jgi:hypothetical protein
VLTAELERCYRCQSPEIGDLHEQISSMMGWDDEQDGHRPNPIGVLPADPSGMRQCRACGHVWRVDD